MKIAYICADQGIPVLGYKGASVHVREFTDALIELGHEVRIYCAAGSAKRGQGSGQNRTRAVLTILEPSEETRRAAKLFANSLTRLGWEHEPAHLLSETQHLLADPAFGIRVLPLLQAFAPDVLIARHALFSLAGVELARELGCPVVLEVNAPLAEERLRHWGLTLQREAKQAERAAFTGADLLVAVSEEVRAYLLSAGAASSRIAVLPNGVNLARFHPDVDGTSVRRRYGLEGRIVLGFTGSLKLWHGVDGLLRAFADLQGAQREHEQMLHLLIVGDGPQRKPLQDLSQELGISEQITFTGAVPHAEIPAHVAAFDIAVAPYRFSDNFYFSSLKVMEYLAMGRATVVPGIGQLPSLLQGATGQCGLLYRPDDQFDLAQSLRQLISDAPFRRTLGARAAEQARQRFSWQQVAEQVLACVNALHSEQPLSQVAP